MASKARAAVLVAPRQLEVQEFPLPQIGPDDGLLKVERCGICGSDVEHYNGHGRVNYPSIPGHEPLGIIEQVGQRAAERWGVQPGDRVAVEILIPCRTCELCLTGNYQACRNKRFGSYGGNTLTSKEPPLWGGYAEYLYLHPNAILHKINKDLPADLAVMFNPLGAGVRWALHLGQLQLGGSILILGPGQRGLCAVVAAKMIGAATIIVTGLSKDRHKLTLAREIGATHTIVVDAENTVERVREFTDGVGTDVVLDVTPLATQPILDALECVKFGGRIVLAGLKARKPTTLITDMLIQKSASMVGAYSVDARAYVDAIRIIESGQLPLEKLHTHTFGLEDAGRAVEVLAGEVEGEEAIHVSIDPHA